MKTKLSLLTLTAVLCAAGLANAQSETSLQWSLFDALNNTFNGAPATCIWENATTATYSAKQGGTLNIDSDFVKNAHGNVSITAPATDTNSFKVLEFDAYDGNSKASSTPKMKSYVAVIHYVSTRDTVFVPTLNNTLQNYNLPTIEANDLSIGWNKLSTVSVNNANNIDRNACSGSVETPMMTAQADTANARTVSAKTTTTGWLKHTETGIQPLGR